MATDVLGFVTPWRAITKCSVCRGTIRRFIQWYFIVTTTDCWFANRGVNWNSIDLIIQRSQTHLSTLNCRRVTYIIMIQVRPFIMVHPMELSGLWKVKPGPLMYTCGGGGVANVGIIIIFGWSLSSPVPLKNSGQGEYQVPSTIQTWLKTVIINLVKWMISFAQLE